MRHGCEGISLSPNKTAHPVSPRLDQRAHVRLLLALPHADIVEVAIQGEHHRLRLHFADEIAHAALIRPLDHRRDVARLVERERDRERAKGRRFGNLGGQSAANDQDSDAGIEQVWHKVSIYGWV